MGYLDRVIRQCKSTARPHESDFVKLREILRQAKHITITTAGALRSSANFLEELVLLDQGSQALASESRNSPTAKERVQAPEFRGILDLSQQSSNELARTITVLDAVIRHRHHSAGSFHAWRAKSPLRQMLLRNAHNCPELHKLILKRGTRGITVNFESILSDLVGIWSSEDENHLDRESARALIARYHPQASQIMANDRMSSVFQAARKQVAEAGV